MRSKAAAIAVLLVLAVAAGSFSACTPEVTESIDAVRGIAGDAAGGPEPTLTTEPSVAADPSPASPEVQSILVALNGLHVAERYSGIEYNRNDWRHWIDVDRDCQNTRAEVLIAESVAAVTFALEDDRDQCRVISGRWVGPWTGAVFTDASDVDIDHHVPLAHAHLSGGWDWPPERKRAYANDLANPVSLQATDSSVNRAKGKKPPDEWRPEDPAGWCRYAADWVSVKRKWELTVTMIEVRALEDMLSTCDDSASWGLSGPPGNR